MAEEEVVRKLLIEIDRDPTVSQKRLAEEIGISVGMINWHVKRCVSKGLVKLQQAPVRRYLYYLTPEGFSEKADLTARYLQSSFNIFRVGREQYEVLFAECQRNGWHRIALLGHSELTELAQLVVVGRDDIDLCEIISLSSSQTQAVSSSVDPVTARETGAEGDRQGIDAVIVTHFLTAEQNLRQDELFVAQLGLERSRLLVPEFLL